MLHVIKGLNILLQNMHGSFRQRGEGAQAQLTDREKSSDAYIFLVSNLLDRGTQWFISGKTSSEGGWGGRVCNISRGSNC